ncbi:MAG TPA: T9SS type A sorting domain-containing protein, partial [Flavobacteriales bacterium]|nr:T9SS type A sorting domain-containing protein [Flavobacteriales bacterium]
NSGAFASTMDFDPSAGTFNLISAGSNDAYVVELDASGNFEWAISAGGSGDESGQSVKLGAGKIFLAGRFNTTADFDPDAVGVANLTSGGLTDIFVAQYQPACTPTDSTITTSACNDYTLNSTTYTSSGVYTQLLTNAAGCDSTITLNLTINLETDSTIAASSCDSYTLNSTTYTSSGIYTQLLTNAAGCDSTITLNLTIILSTDSTITATACESYTLNSTTYTGSGTYIQTLTNGVGCDSTLTLNLTIDTISVAVTTSSNTITATMAGATYQWINCSTFTPIGGETNQSFTATSNGSYAVIVTNGTCTDTSTCTTITGIGINEPMNNHVLQLYPNPVNDNITIQLAQPGSIVMSDVAGNIVYTSAVSSQRHILDVKGLANGVYAVRVSGSNGQAQVFMKH